MPGSTGDLSGLASQSTTSKSASTAQQMMRWTSRGTLGWSAGSSSCPIAHLSGLPDSIAPASQVPLNLLQVCCS
eukprot:CAMPEP_0203969576 /NCGR_PEP_ID=MMETSP0359-20131031/97527_1 /ASSEMBLY_ACC=CAM_ASM_000338 /TAXON_ID=268821 /ORGANISM="Scrippsiella Hangoei, Strain SHTV-5" /LENGTH=73 /DNA_ID=CAMNT_0050907517 /DNA_START=413 /DNA_END=634 /DNA_ORIENTATION=+